MNTKSSHDLIRPILAATLILLLLPHPAFAQQLAELNLPDAPQPQQSTAAPPPASAPAAPPAAPAQSLSLSDLGFSSAQQQSDAARQALLDKRSHMLKIHQRLGLLTTIPMAATLLSSAAAPCEHNCNGNSAGMDFHAALGTVTVGMYAATAYFAIRAPEVPGDKPRGAIRIHRYLAPVHMTGMVLTPILGAMAFNQQNNGQKVTGIASAHGAVATTTFVAYAASIVAVSWPIHYKFWEKSN